MSKIHKVLISMKDLKGLEIYTCKKCKITRFIDMPKTPFIKCSECEKLMLRLGKKERKAKLKEILMGIFPVIIE